MARKYNYSKSDRDDSRANTSYCYANAAVNRTPKGYRDGEAGGRGRYPEKRYDDAAANRVPEGYQEGDVGGRDRYPEKRYDANRNDRAGGDESYRAEDGRYNRQDRKEGDYDRVGRAEAANYDKADRNREDYGMRTNDKFKTASMLALSIAVASVLSFASGTEGVVLGSVNGLNEGAVTIHQNPGDSLLNELSISADLADLAEFTPASLADENLWGNSELASKAFGAPPAFATAGPAEVFAAFGSDLAIKTHAIEGAVASEPLALAVVAIGAPISGANGAFANEAFVVNHAAVAIPRQLAGPENFVSTVDLSLDFGAAAGERVLAAAGTPALGFVGGAREVSFGLQDDARLLANADAGLPSPFINFDSFLL